MASLGVTAGSMPQQAAAIELQVQEVPRTT